MTIYSKVISSQSSQSKKYSRPFGFEATFFASLFSESLLSERPGFDPRPGQTLRAHNFEALGPAGSKTNFFDISIQGNIRAFQRGIKSAFLSTNFKVTRHQSWWSLKKKTKSPTTYILNAILCSESLLS